MDTVLLNEYLRLKSENLKLKMEIEDLKPKIYKEVNANNGKIIYNGAKLYSRISKTYQFSENIQNLITLVKEQKLEEIESGIASTTKENRYVIVKFDRVVKNSLKDDSSDDKKNSFISKTREKHPNAYAKWSDEEEELLRREYQNGTPIPQIAKNFNRQVGGIRSRLKRLDLL
tara:strand:+ start:137 stop:655 length:519 start_codon:yes stop_codon:yes gene_type:complete